MDRGADLGGKTVALLRFDWSTTAGVDSSDRVVVEASGNGGSSWTVLETFTGFFGAQSGSRSYDLVALGLATAQTRVRVRVTNLYGGTNEQFRLDFLEIQSDSPAPCGIDHYAVIHDGSGVICQPEDVAIEVHDAGDVPVAGYTGSIAISTDTGHGDWSLVSGAGSLVNAGSGVATYTFDASDGGRV